jgi:hypothetical protein
MTPVEIESMQRAERQRAQALFDAWKPETFDQHRVNVLAAIVKRGADELAETQAANKRLADENANLRADIRPLVEQCANLRLRNADIEADVLTLDFIACHVNRIEIYSGYMLVLGVDAEGSTFSAASVSGKSNAERLRSAVDHARSATSRTLAETPEPITMCEHDRRAL